MAEREEGSLDKERLRGIAPAIQNGENPSSFDKLRMRKKRSGDWMRSTCELREPSPFDRSRMRKTIDAV